MLLVQPAMLAQKRSQAVADQNKVKHTCERIACYLHDDGHRYRACSLHQTATTMLLMLLWSANN